MSEKKINHGNDRFDGYHAECAIEMHFHWNQNEENYSIKISNSRIEQRKTRILTAAPIWTESEEFQLFFEIKLLRVSPCSEPRHSRGDEIGMIVRGGEDDILFWANCNKISRHDVIKLAVKLNFLFSLVLSLTSTYEGVFTLKQDGEDFRWHFRIYQILKFCLKKCKRLLLYFNSIKFKLTW